MLISDLNEILAQNNLAFSTCVHSWCWWLSERLFKGSVSLGKPFAGCAYNAAARFLPRTSAAYAVIRCPSVRLSRWCTCLTACGWHQRSLLVAIFALLTPQRCRCCRLVGLPLATPPVCHRRLGPAPYFDISNGDQVSPFSSVIRLTWRCPLWRSADVCIESCNSLDVDFVKGPRNCVMAAL